jgi:hypothetical protein
MEKLFTALENKHLGYKIVDMHFSTDNSASSYSIAELDAILADAVENAKQIDISTYFTNIA